MATMKDVAKKAGVSTYTVSNVLNNLSYLKEETRQKVLDAIDELDYKPNYAVSSCVHRVREILVYHSQF